MQNTIKFPSDSEFQLSHYFIYKDLKAVEAIAFDRAYRYFMVLTASNNIYIYDNYTKLNLGKVDFCESLRKSPISVQYEPLLKAYSDKEKQKLIDSLSFSKSEDFIALASAKLASVFLIRTNLTGLLRDPEIEPQVLGFIQLKPSTNKDICLKLVMDPFSKYSCMLSGNSVILTNFKVPVDFGIPLKKEKEEMEIEKKELKDVEENKNVLGEYLDIYCSKTQKRILICDQDSIGVYTVEYNKKIYSNLSVLIYVKNYAAPKISQIVINYNCCLFIIQYHKKLAKVFGINWGDKLIYQKVEFEANEGRSWYDVIFNVYKNQSEEFEDWIILSFLVEKNPFSSGISWYNCETKVLKHEMMESNLRVKKIFSNLLWKSSILGILESGALLNIELKQPSSWVRFSYKFGYTNENVEYIEKEDEFDKEEDQPEILPLNLGKRGFDLLPDHSLGSLFYKQKNIFTPKFLPLERLPERKMVIKEEDDEEEEEKEEYDNEDDDEDEEDQDEEGIKEEDGESQGIKEEHPEGWLKEEDAREISSPGASDDEEHAMNEPRDDSNIEAKLEEQDTKEREFNEILQIAKNYKRK